MKFNLNQTVKIQLTDYGRNILRQQGKGYMLRREKGGWSEWQLWDLMRTFGPYLRMGINVDQPFNPNIELIEDS